MRTLVLALMAFAALPIAAAQGSCSAEVAGEQWNISAGSKSYSLKTGVDLAVPITGKIRFVQLDQYTVYLYNTSETAEFNYRSDGDIFFRTTALAVKVGDQWTSIVPILNAEGKQLLVAFRDPGGEIFALTALGDQMAEGQPTQFGILKAEQAAPLRERLENGKPFDVLIATNEALIAEKAGYTFPAFPDAKYKADALLEELKAKAASGACQ